MTTDRGMYASGWRPAIGWICAVACAWNWIAISIISTVAAIAGHPQQLPAADIEQMIPVLLGLLGLGGLRTYEKVKGVSREK